MLSTRLLLVTPLAAALLSACVVAPYPARRVVYTEPVPAGEVPGPVDSGVVVDVAPPAPYVEVQPAIPFPGAIWIGGYWGWGGGRHYWVPGRWDHPRPGYRWQPHAWYNQNGHWHLRAGGWVR